MTEIPPDLRRAAEAWLDDDPDPETRNELRHALESGDADGLADRFAGTLQFGTAGLRGIIGAGPNRMNRVVVARATAGLCTHLLRTTPDAARRGIVVGYDGRRLSRELAHETAAVIAGHGIVAHVFEHVAPTPLTAFAVLDRSAAAGVMVTASHNPPEYNGYKVYWGNGAQIIPPQDDGIATCIAAVGPMESIPRKTREDAHAVGLLRVLGDDVEQRYLDAIVDLQVHTELPRDLRIAYTALHGVGERVLRRAFEAAGFEDFFSVAEQAQPDGRFPTVAFPNPEEKGAMDLVLALARKVRADIVVANDPDADRLSLAVRDGDGAYVQLTGNDVGALLGHYLLSEGEQGGDRLVACSIVSSPMLGAIAAAHGARWEQTLTGFKWIANRAMELERATRARFVFGYEEALGYTVGTTVRDKDGIGAALVACDMAAWCKAQGRTLLGELEVAWRRYGLFASRQVSITKKGADGSAAITRIMEAVRRAPPDRVGTHDVTAVMDLAARTRAPRGQTPERLALPPSNAIALELAGGHRIMLRPSGTEPKIKYYFDVCVALGEGEPAAAARARGAALIDELVAAFMPIVDVVA